MARGHRRVGADRQDVATRIDLDRAYAGCANILGKQDRPRRVDRHVTAISIAEEVDPDRFVGFQPVRIGAPFRKAHVRRRGDDILVVDQIENTVRRRRLADEILLIVQDLAAFLKIVSVRVGLGERVEEVEVLIRDLDIADFGFVRQVHQLRRADQRDAEIVVLLVAASDEADAGVCDFRVHPPLFDRAVVGGRVVKGHVIDGVVERLRRRGRVGPVAQVDLDGRIPFGQPILGRQVNGLPTDEDRVLGDLVLVDDTDDALDTFVRAKVDVREHEVAGGIADDIERAIPVRRDDFAIAGRYDLAGNLDEPAFGADRRDFELIRDRVVVHRNIAGHIGIAGERRGRVVSDPTDHVDVRLIRIAADRLTTKRRIERNDRAAPAGIEIGVDGRADREIPVCHTGLNAAVDVQDIGIDEDVADSGDRAARRTIRQNFGRLGPID